MTYEWDPDKALINRDKRDVSFADAVEVFSDEYAITTDDHTSHEQRHTAIGFDVLGRLLVVVYAWRSMPGGKRTSELFRQEKLPPESGRHMERTDEKGI